MEIYRDVNETFFPTSTPAIADELSLQLNTAQREIERLKDIISRNSTEINDYRLKIAAIDGYIADYYSDNGTVSDELKDIAGYLGITLTKRISGSATFEISWSAQVPLDFDPDDFEISFDVDCDTYEADDFDWQTETHEVSAEDDY